MNTLALINQSAQKEIERYNRELNSEIMNAIYDAPKYTYLTNLMSKKVKKYFLELQNGEYCGDSKDYFEFPIEQYKKNVYEPTLKKALKLVENRRAEKIAKLTEIQNAPDMVSAKLVIEWTKSKMWGMNPKAFLDIYTKENHFDFTSDSISGCGYCKESTAFAQAFNKSCSFLKLLDNVQNNPEISDVRKYMPYGLNHSEILGLAGGVGVECYYKIFEKLGFELKRIADTKTSTVFTITKKELTND